MKYLLYDLGAALAGDVIETSLGYAANVRVFNRQNCELFEQGAKHSFIGGYIEKTPYRVTVPETGDWFVAIDSGSYFGKIKSSVKLIPRSGAAEGREERRPEGAIRERRVAEDLREFPGEAVKRRAKIFILHLYKDTESVVAPLAEALGAEGVSAHYEDYVLEPGDSLEDRIRGGIAKCKSGAVVISRAFLRVGWRQADIEYMKKMLAKEYKELQPVWHNVAKSDVEAILPGLASMVPRSAGARDFKAAADEIISALRL